jgi:predicted Fe-Mo cluster-binding NifX family protein
MLIAITSLGPNLDSLIDPRFGRAAYFLILDEKGELLKSLKNPGKEAFRGAGVSAGQIIIDEKIDVLITQNLGPNALRVLESSKVKTFLVEENLTVKKAFQKYQNE